MADDESERVEADADALFLHGADVPSLRDVTGAAWFEVLSLRGTARPGAPSLRDAAWLEALFLRDAAGAAWLETLFFRAATWLEALLNGIDRLLGLRSDDALACPLPPGAAFDPTL